MTAAAKKRGRPSKKTPELCAEICERLSTGETLRSICLDERMPAWQKVYEWMERDEDFKGRIAHARETGYDAIAENTMEIADDREDDPASRRVRVETRLKLLAKWSPKKYGDKLQAQVEGTTTLTVITGVPSAESER